MLFPGFFLQAADGTAFVTARHHLSLVVLSVLVAICLSIVALHTADIARRTARAHYRRLTIATASFALGGGIWTMHFIGMMAFQLPVPMHHDVPLTAASLIPGLAASWLALMLLSRQSISGRELAGGGLLLGAGIGLMHYTGMMAMRTPLAMRFVPDLFLLSIVVAVVLAVLALWIHTGLQQVRLSARWRFVLGGAVMGSAISGMHYTGMAGVRFLGEVDAATGGHLTSPVYSALALAALAIGLGAVVAAVNALIHSRELYQLVQDEKHQTQQTLNHIMARVHDSIVSVGEGAGRIANSSGQLGERMREQASSLQAAAQSMAEITRAVKDGAGNAAQTDALVKKVQHQATTGGRTVDEAVAAMREIRSASKRITEIVALIDGIAFQTNLLALNASVEAARAGENGRGFAVVAQEVRNLATRSAHSARDIRQLVTENDTRIEAGAQRVEASGAAFTQIEAAVRQVSTLAAEMAAASGQQTEAIGQVNDSVARMNQLTEANAALVRQSAEAGRALATQAIALRDHTATLQGESQPRLEVLQALPSDERAQPIAVSGLPAPAPS